MEHSTRPSRGAILALLLVLCCVFARPASSAIVHVNNIATGAVHDGKTWSTAFTAVQPAINAANAGDEVWVAVGTYVEFITLRDGVSLYGGFAGSEAVRSARNWKAHPAILDGNNSRATPVVSSSVPAATVDGFTIRKAVYGISVTGGAVTVANCTNSAGITISGGTVSVMNCTFGAASAAIVVNAGTANISDCAITGAYQGITASVSGTANLIRSVISATNVGITVSPGGTVNATDSTVITSHDMGSVAFGIKVSGGVATLARCSISGDADGNVVVLAGGKAGISNSFIQGSPIGVYSSASVVAAANSTITGNITGIYLAGGSASISNSIVAFNGTGVYATANPFAVFSHNDVYGNAYGNYSGIVDATGSRGNIALDPAFRNRSGGDYHLVSSSPCIDAGDDSATSRDDEDLDGLPRTSGSHVDIGAYEFRHRNPWTVSLGTGISGGLTVTEGAAYVAGNDGKLYARSTDDGSTVPFLFPVDISTVVGGTVKLPSRPAVYYGKTGKAIYLTTDRGDVVRISPLGAIAWHVRPLSGPTVSTPAVTPDGYVFVNLSTGSGPYNNFVFKLDEATGTPLSLSPFLGYTNAGDLGDFSPAASNRYVYVNSGWGSKNGLTLLNQDNLTVRSSFAGGEQCLSPLLLGPYLVLVTRGGKVYKMNAVTMNPDLGFGRFGVVDVGSQISAAPFADAAGNVFIGTADGRIMKWATGSAAFQPFYTTSGRIGGLTINRGAGVLGFGTSTGAFIQVPLDNPAGAVIVSAGGPITTGTAYESLTDRFIVATDNGLLSGFPSVR